MRAFIVIILTATMHLALMQDALAGSSVKPKSGVDRLFRESGSTLEMEWNESTQTPAVLAGMLTKPSDHTPEWIAVSFVQRNKKLYGLRYPEQDMRIVDVVKNPDATAVVRFQLVLYDTPVWGDGLTVFVNEEGVIRRVEGRMHYDLRKATFHRDKQAVISEQKAVAAAKASLPNDGSSVRATAVSSYYLPTRPGCPLIYVVTLRYIDEREERVMIHASFNKVIAET